MELVHVLQVKAVRYWPCPPDSDEVLERTFETYDANIHIYIIYLYIFFLYIYINLLNRAANLLRETSRLIGEYSLIYLNLWVFFDLKDAIVTYMYMMSLNQNI